MTLLAAQDSSLVNFATSSTKGNFEIKGVAAGNYVLQISFVGYSTYLRWIGFAGQLLKSGFMSMIGVD